MSQSRFPVKDTETRIALLEQTVILQNQSTNEKLEAMTDVLSDISKKLDTHILSQTDRTARLEERADGADKEIAKVSTRVTRAIATTLTAIVAIAAAIVGGIVQMIGLK